MKLRIRITLTICSIIIILTVSLAGVIYFKSASIIDKNSETLMTAQLDRVEENIDLLVKLHMLQTKELALDKKLQIFLDGKMSVDRINNYLTNLMKEKNKSHNYYMDLFIIDKNGYIIASSMTSAMNLDLSKRKYFLKSVRNHTTIMSDILVSKSNNLFILNSVSPITNFKGEVLGYAGISIHAEYFSEIINRLKLGESGYYSIVDSDGLILAHSNKNLVGKSSMFNVTNRDFISNYNNIIKQEKNISGKDTEFQVFKFMKNTHWILIAAIPQRDMYSQSTSLLYSVIFIGIISLIIAIFIGVYVSNKISVPIVAMTECMDIISSGNSVLDKSIAESIDILKSNYEDADEQKIAYHKYEEIGKFQKSFRNMSKNIWLTLRNFENESNTLTKSSEQLAHTVDDIYIGTGRFISTLSHDLKNSITVIKGYSKGLKMGIIQDENVKNQFIDGIYTRTDEIEKIIYDVLDTAYEAQGKMKIYKEFIDLIFFADELIESAEQYIKSKGFIFEKIIDLKYGMLNIDITKIKRVWNNLINNAVKYSEIGGKITVRIIKHDNEVNFQVEDEGIGISTDEMDKIFNMFYRCSNINQNGYGLGLFIAKSILEEHNSILSVKNGKYKGSVFMFDLIVNNV